MDVARRYLHIFHRINGHTGHADIATHTRMVRVVAAMRGQIKSHTQTLLASGKVLAVERIGLFGRTKAGVLQISISPRAAAACLNQSSGSYLSHSPRLGRVHGRVRTSCERERARRL